MVCLPEHQKNERQRRQKAPAFIGVAGVFISFDTSQVFMVMGGEAASPALWEVHPKRGRMRKAPSLSAVQATALTRRQSSRCSAREWQKQCWVYQVIAGYSSSKASCGTSQQYHDQS